MCLDQMMNFSRCFLNPSLLSFSSSLLMINRSVQFRILTQFLKFTRYYYFKRTVDVITSPPPIFRKMACPIRNINLENFLYFRLNQTSIIFKKNIYIYFQFQLLDFLLQKQQIRSDNKNLLSSKNDDLFHLNDQIKVYSVQYYYYSVNRVLPFLY